MNLTSSLQYKQCNIFNHLYFQSLWQSWNFENPSCQELIACPQSLLLSVRVDGMWCFLCTFIVSLSLSTLQTIPVFMLCSGSVFPRKNWGSQISTSAKHWQPCLKPDQHPTFSACFWAGVDSETAKEFGFLGINTASLRECIVQICC